MLAMQEVGDFCACWGGLWIVMRCGLGGNVRVGARSGGTSWDVSGDGEDLLGGVKLSLASLWSNVLASSGYSHLCLCVGVVAAPSGLGSYDTSKDLSKDLGCDERKAGYCGADLTSRAKARELCGCGQYLELGECGRGAWLGVGLVVA